MEKKTKKNCSISIDEDILKYLDEICYKSGFKRTNVIQIALKMLFQNLKNGDVNLANIAFIDFQSSKNDKNSQESFKSETQDYCTHKDKTTSASQSNIDRGNDLTKSETGVNFKF